MIVDIFQMTRRYGEQEIKIRFVEASIIVGVTQYNC